LHSHHVGISDGWKYKYAVASSDMAIPNFLKIYQSVETLLTWGGEGQTQTHAVYIISLPFLMDVG
jgi:hypothetical protein